jgi:hypothetical protein
MNIAPITAFAGCVMTCGAILWRLSGAISKLESRHERNSERISDNKDAIDLFSRGFEQQLSHTKERLLGQTEDLDRRMDAIEHFLIKTTEFQKHDSGRNKKTF